MKATQGTKIKYTCNNLVTEDKKLVKLGDDKATIAGQGTGIIAITDKAAPNNYCTSRNAQPESDALNTL